MFYAGLMGVDVFYKLSERLFVRFLEVVTSCSQL